VSATTIEITDTGLATLSIPDADGELRSYRFRLAPRGLSLWALEITRADTDATYRVCEDVPGRWTCNCPAETYRKRGADHCKHCAAVRALRAFLREFSQESINARSHPARSA
jgi:hypothetical protein